MAKTARAIKAVLKPASEILSEAVIKGLKEVKGKEIVSIDLRGINGAVADFFIVCHGESSTQVSGLAKSVEKVVFSEMNEWPLFIEGQQNAKWVLIDYINVVVHIFQFEQREFYGIEQLWADGKVVEISDN